MALLTASILLVWLSLASTSPLSPYEYINTSSPQRYGNYSSSSAEPSKDTNNKSFNPEYRQLESSFGTKINNDFTDDEKTEKTEVTLRQALTIVEKRRLTECVARCICELSCNPESKSSQSDSHILSIFYFDCLTGYGSKGKSVYKTLRQFESDTLPQLAFYKEASNNGKRFRPKCDLCYNSYNCKTSTDTLIRLASALTIKS